MSCLNEESRTAVHTECRERRPRGKLLLENRNNRTVRFDAVLPLTVLRVLRNTWLTHSIGTLIKGPSVSMAPAHPNDVLPFRSPLLG